MPNTSLYKPEAYPNQLGYIRISSNEIRNSICNFKLDFIDYRNSDAEWEIKFPPFVRAFYNYIAKWGKVPTQKAFYDFYLRYYAPFFAANTFGPDVMKGLKARVFRTYPSLVRDLYFNKYLEEQLPQYSVLYNINLDLEKDIDTMIVKDGKYWAACLYTETRRANNARGKKVYRHKRFDNVNYIEFPVEMCDERKVGEFFLYGEAEMQELLRRM